MRDKRRIIEKFLANEDFLLTAADLGIKRTSAYTIVRRYQRTGDVMDMRSSGGRKKLLDNESIDFLVMMVEDVPTISVRELNEYLRATFNLKPHVSDSTVGRALDGELITLKKCHNIPEERNSLQVKDKRVEYAHYMYERGLQQHRIYIDESGYNLYTKRTYGRARRGERVNRIVGGQRGGNITLIAAVSDRCGLLYYEVHTASVTKETFLNFLTSLEAILGEEEAVLILDNAPVHRGMNELFPDLNFKFLPPHSPFLNPIENCFSVLKCRLKQHLNSFAGTCNAAAARRAGVTLRTFRENHLVSRLEESLEVINAELVDKNCRYSNRYLMKCLSREDICE